MTVTIHFNDKRSNIIVEILNVTMVETIASKLVILYTERESFSSYTAIKHFPMCEIDYYVVKNE